MKIKMKKEYLAKVGNIVRQLRKEKGLTQERLAARAELNTTYLSDIENGTGNATVGVLVRLAGGLKVKPAQLLEIEVTG